MIYEYSPLQLSTLATPLLLMQFVNKLQQICQFLQVATHLLKSGLLQLVTTASNKPVDKKF